MGGWERDSAESATQRSKPELPELTHHVVPYNSPPPNTSATMRALLLLITTALVCCHDPPTALGGLASLQVILFGPYGSLARKFLWQGILELDESVGPTGAHVSVFACSLGEPSTALAAIREIIDGTQCLSLPAQECAALRDSLFSRVAYFRTRDEAGFMQLGAALASDYASSVASRIAYLAVATDLAPRIIAGLSIAGVRVDTGAARVLLEKPVGRDGASAAALLSAIASSGAPPAATFIVDHYLAKPGLAAVTDIRQRLLPLLWRRGPGAPLAWRATALESAILESESLAGRAGYFNGYGITRDVLQNHATEMLAAALLPAGAAWDAPGRVAALSRLHHTPGASHAPAAAGSTEAAPSSVLGVYEGYAEAAAAELAPPRAPGSPPPSTQVSGAKCPPLLPLVATAARHVLWAEVEGESGSGRRALPRIPAVLLAGKALSGRSAYLRWSLQAQAETAGGAQAVAATVTVRVQGSLSLATPPGLDLASLQPPLPPSTSDGPAVLLVLQYAQNQPHQKGWTDDGTKGGPVLDAALHALQRAADDLIAALLLHPHTPSHGASEAHWAAHIHRATSRDGSQLVVLATLTAANEEASSATAGVCKRPLRELQHQHQLGADGSTIALSTVEGLSASSGSGASASRACLSSVAATPASGSVAAYKRLIAAALTSPFSSNGTSSVATDAGPFSALFTSPAEVRALWQLWDPVLELEDASLKRAAAADDDASGVLAWDSEKGVWLQRRPAAPCSDGAAATPGSASSAPAMPAGGAAPLQVYSYPPGSDAWLRGTETYSL
jgi:hypothetical protein